MNTATFRTYIELLGMEHTWIAAQLDVGVRSVEYWTAVPKHGKPERRPPFDAEELVLYWVDQFDQIVSNVVDSVADYRDEYGEPPREVDLRRYVTEASFTRGEGDGTMSHSMHNALLRQIAFALAVEGYEVSVNWVPVEE